MFRTSRLESSPPFLAPGHGDYLVYVPTVLSGRIEATPDQLENAYVNGVALSLGLVYCQSIPRGMALWSLLIHIAGTTKAFSRAAAEAFMPDVLEAIDAHRNDRPQDFLRLVMSYCGIQVCYMLSLDLLCKACIDLVFK